MRLSVIVPIYGVARYLWRALESLREQSAEGVEYILVDDGSKDGCGAIVDICARKDKRFIAVHQENGGYGKAVNKGLAMAKGEYIAIFEPDDWVEPDFYVGLLKRAEETKADIVKTGFVDFFDDGRPGGSGIAASFDGESKEGADFTIEKCPKLLAQHPSIWSAIYNRAFLEREGIVMEETPGACWQDNLFQVKTALKAKSIAFAPGRGYHYRVFPGKRAPEPKRILGVVGGIRDWMEENGVGAPEVVAAEAMRELWYVGLAFEWKRPFRLVGIMRRIRKDLRSVPENRLRELGILADRMRSRYGWAKAGVILGLLRQALPQLRYWIEGKIRCM
ncbi:MAG: glycosyltransferase [Kiritimatiellae bacterium]|nr:glycosyltransferase [Kiritimatiellia bacterium]